MTSRALVSLDPEGEGGVVVSPHLIGCEHWGDGSKSAESKWWESNGSKSDGMAE